jgi:hypothetical protein
MYSVDVDISQVVTLSAKVLRKLPYILNDSITEVAKLVVAAEQDQLRKDFTIRKNFLTGRFKVLQYSRTTDLTAIVGIDNRVQGSPLLLGFFEEGGSKLPTAGPELAIPLTGEAARPSFASPIPTALLYKNLQISMKIKGHAVIFPGLQHTYLVQGVGVFQRTGKSTELIYSFKPSAPLRPRTHMIELAQVVIRESFARIFDKNFVQEIQESRL